MNATGVAPLGSYELLERVGEGATSVVYRATDRFGRTVAVKEPRSDIAHDPAIRRRLGREARTMARVRSPYVAEVLDACLEGDRPYLVAEYVAGVLHRDLKPGNVMVLGGIPKIIDFGIAQETGAEQVTQPGVLTGTPGYVAPELIDGGLCGEASDVFSWAATVAFAATGRPPFGAGSLHGICFRVLRGAADLDGVPEPVLPLLRRALSRDPAERPTAASLAGRLAERRPVPAS